MATTDTPTHLGVRDRSSYIQILLAIAAVSAVAFVIIEFCHPEPLVELRLFRSPQFIMAVSVMCLTPIGLSQYRADVSRAHAAHARL